MLTDKELAAVPEELLEDLLRYSEYGWRERRIATCRSPFMSDLRFCAGWVSHT